MAKNVGVKKEQSLIMLLLLFLGAVVAFGTNFTVATYALPSKFVEHGPIYIDSDSGFGGFPGSGTPSDPYVIEGLEIITSEDYAIYIANTNAYFIIRNCIVSGDNFGIFITNVGADTAVIENNTCYNTDEDGIHAEFSDGVIIRDNICYGNAANGIFVKMCNNAVVMGNICNRNGGSSGHFSGGGIWVEQSTDVVIKNNICNENTDQRPGITSYSNTRPWIENNTCLYNSGHGFYVVFSDYLTLTHNRAVGAGTVDADGICIWYSDYISIEWNKIENYTSNGKPMSLCGDGFGVSITHNKIKHASTSGIFFGYENPSSDIYIANNAILDCYAGVDMTYIENSTILGNIFYDCDEYGVAISSNCKNNLIYLNSFIDNNVGGYSQAFDDGINNTWYNEASMEGNYWSDWSGGNYSIDGNSGSLDIYPLNSSDFDSDGLSDIEELETYHTDPFNPDTDNDGLNDSAEVIIYNTDPFKFDTDDDGLNDYEEVVIYYTDPNDKDTDNDMIPDGWEAHNNMDPLNNSDANADFDNDGLTNYNEFIYNTDPWNGDTDFDGLTDSEEVNIYHTIPTNPDSDGDGLKDGEEVYSYYTDPLNPDSDRDGLTDYDEIFVYYTNPNKSDTDDDGMPDGWEIAHQLDPKINDANEDPDQDGLRNIEEFNYHTDPHDYDTDGDGYGDGEEVHAGTDPLDPYSNPGETPTGTTGTETQTETSEPTETSVNTLKIPVSYSAIIITLFLIGFALLNRRRT